MFWFYAPPPDVLPPGLRFPKTPQKRGGFSGAPAGPRGQNRARIKFRLRGRGGGVSPGGLFPLYPIRKTPAKRVGGDAVFKLGGGGVFLFLPPHGGGRRFGGRPPNRFGVLSDGGKPHHFYRGRWEDAILQKWFLTPKGGGFKKGGFKNLGGTKPRGGPGVFPMGAHSRVKREISRGCRGTVYPRKKGVPRKGNGGAGKEGNP